MIVGSVTEALCLKLEADARLNAEARSCTGTLASHPRSRDIKISTFSITFHGCELLQDTMLELNCTRRYGLLGLNGSGKSTLLAVLGKREVPIPDQIDIFHLTREMPASNKTALECVMEVDEERVRLEKLAEELVECAEEDAQVRGRSQRCRLFQRSINLRCTTLILYRNNLWTFTKGWRTCPLTRRRPVLLIYCTVWVSRRRCRTRLPKTSPEAGE